MGSLEVWRDVAVIILAIMNLVFLVVMTVIAFLIYKKLGPLLTSATTTVNNIQATTSFVAETTVHPIIRVLSYLAGMKAAARTVGSMGKGKGGR